MADRYSDDTLDNALVIIDLISLSDEALHELYRRVRVELQRREVPWEILEDTADISEAPAAAAAPPAGGEVPAQKPAEENTQDVQRTYYMAPTGRVYHVIRNCTGLRNASRVDTSTTTCGRRACAYCWKE